MTKEKLSPIERERYINWHKENAELDLEEAEEILEKSQKWSIIAGYYAMHNAAKYYLGKVFNLKISAPSAHDETLKALEQFLIKSPTYKEIKKLILEAEKEFETLIGADASTIANQYRLGKEKREKQTYYTRFQGKKEDAQGFLDEIVKPFIKIIMELEE